MGLISKGQLFLKRNSSTILTFIAAGGVVITTISAVKATPKALRAIEAAKEEKGEELTKMETVVAAGPAYIPTVITGVTTITCIFGANALNKRQQASLMSAYAFLNNSYNQYVDKVRELMGEDTHTLIRNEIAREAYEENGVSVRGDKQLFYIHNAIEFFESTIEDVKNAEEVVNLMLAENGYVSLNEYYSLIGMPIVDDGYMLGWSTRTLRDAGYSKIEIDYDKFVIKDSLGDDDIEIMSIEILTEPIEGYMFC